MVEIYQGNALCQAVKLEGLSSGSERRLEDRIRALISNNGPEFVVDILKQLKQHCIDSLDNEVQYSNKEYGSPTIAWNHKLNRPKGGLGVIYTEFKDPQKRLRVIGSIINTIELDAPSARQVQRFMDGVEYNNRTAHDVVAVIHDYEVSDLQHCLRSKLMNWSRSFSGEDMTGSTVPEGMESTSIAYDKAVLGSRRQNARSDERARAIARLESTTVNQVYLAPKPVHQYVAKHMSGEFVKNPVYLKRPTPIKARPYDGNTKFGLHIEDYRPYVGTIGMLQQPGAKLRTVVNVNRYVNYAMEPFAKAMEGVFYKQPQISVLDQKDGMKWAQEQLRAGRTLASIDLSQATDLMDFRVLTRALLASPRCEDELRETLELFSYIAESPFYQPELQIGVTMNTGQPLGLKGSFQVLTVMNYLAGREACKSVGLYDLPFRVVGDDMIIDARAAERYSEIIHSWSGKTNYEKMLTSDRYAEFCSHIITPSKIVSMKPHYLAGYHNVYVNAQKTSYNKLVHVYRLTAEDKTNLLALGMVSDEDRENIPFLRYSNKLPLDQRDLVSIAKGLYTELGRIDSSETVTVSAESVDLALQENPQVYNLRRRELDRSRYTRTPDGNRVYHSPATVFDDDRTFNPVVDTYDHKSGQRVPKENRKDLLKRNRADAKVVSQLVEDLAFGKPSEIKIPGHDTTISTTAFLVNAADVQKRQELVRKADEATSQAIISNEIHVDQNVLPKFSLSDKQMKLKLDEIMKANGLKDLDEQSEVDYSNYLP